MNKDTCLYFCMFHVKIIKLKSKKKEMVKNKGKDALRLTI